MKKWKNIWFLISLFLFLPMILSVVLVLWFKEFLEHDFVAKLISISGYFFTLSSLILVFILFNAFKVSDYKKSEASRDFLEKKAFEKLSSSLQIILDCMKKNETKNLYHSCMTVREIFDSLKTYEADVDLKAYSNEIKAVVNVLNKYKLSSIGYNSDIQKLQAMRESYKLDIVNKTDRLLRQLEQRSSLDEPQ